MDPNHRVISRIREAIKKRMDLDPAHLITAVHIPSHLTSLVKIYGDINWIIEGNNSADKLAQEASKDSQGNERENPGGCLEWELKTISKPSQYMRN